MLFQGSNKQMNNSTHATCNKSTVNKSAIKPIKRKDNFIVYSCKQVWSLLAGFWARLRKFMWIGSTGFIILIVPFVFAYMQQMQNEMIRMMQMQNGNRMM